MNIVSLLPSATEIVCALELTDRLVGICHESDHPASITRLPRVTSSAIPPDLPSGEIDRFVREHLRDHASLYTLDLARLERLRPDLILTQALCNVCAVSADDVEAAVCALPSHPTVLNLEPQTLGEVLETNRRIAEAAGVPERGDSVNAKLERRLDAVRAAAPTSRPSVVMLEWIDPPFCGGHWNPELIAIAGGEDRLGQPGQPSRTVEWSEIVEIDPEVLILACCGQSAERTRQDLPLLERRPHWSELRCVRNGRVHLCDGNAYFSRPGPRLVDGVEWLAKVLAEPQK